MNSVSVETRSPFSCKIVFRETLFPQEVYARIGIALVLVKAISYWLISFWQHKAEPLPVIAMFRVGDIQYYPLISACAQWRLGESVLYEKFGEGVAYFPCLSVSAQALGMRFLGPAGLIMADILVTVSYYLIFVILLRMLGVAKIGAECAGWLVVSGALTPISDNLREFYRLEKTFRFSLLAVLGGSAFLLGCIVLVLISRKHASVPHWMTKTGLAAMSGVLLLSVVPIGTPVLWGWRIFRPFLSETLVLCGLCSIYRLLFARPPSILKRFPDWRWGTGGLIFAAVFQSDIYSAEILAITFFLGAVYIFWCFFEYRKAWLSYLQGTLFFVSTAIVGSSPFLVQYWLAHPDTSRRFGVFPIDRITIIWLPGWAHYAVFGAFCLCGLLLLHLPYNAVREDLRNSVIFLLIVCFSALIALPVSGIVLGKGIQLYHFADRFRKLFMYSVIILAGHTITSFSLYVPKMGYLEGKRRYHAVVGKMIVYAVMLVSLVASIEHAVRLSQKGTHMRSELEEYGSLPQYRADFLGVITELQQYSQLGDRVVGTFDHQLYSWWITFEKGFSFIPDPLLFTGADHEIELRLGLLCHLLGMDPDQFHEFMMRPYVNHFWLAHNKYKVSKLHAIAPLSDYVPEEIQTAIEQQGILGGTFVIPLSEQERLRQDYVGIGSFPEDLKLDVIVLTNDAFLSQFHPPEELFALIYENATFRVWRRRNGAIQ